jgi:hypothetical protein
MRTSNVKKYFSCKFRDFESYVVEECIILEYEPASLDKHVPTSLPSSSRVKRCERFFRTAETLKMKDLPSLGKSGTAYPVTKWHISEERVPLDFGEGRKHNSSERPELLTQ